MSEIETALLIVLIIVIILLVWRWVRASGDLCLQDCKKQCNWIKKAETARKSNYGSDPHYSPLNPDLSAARKAERDGYSDADTSHDPNESLYGPGGDAHDSYVAAQLESMSDRQRRARTPLEEDALTTYNTNDELMRHAGLDSSVVRGHQLFLNEMPHKSTGASALSLTDHDMPANRWMGLTRPQMQIAKSDVGSRVVSSEDHRQMHPGQQMRWQNSANDYNIFGEPGW